MGNNAKQRSSGKLVGGITGQGFMPGRSGNPNGRPRTSGLLNVLRETVQSVTEEGRTVEERLVEALD